MTVADKDRVGIDLDSRVITRQVSAPFPVGRRITPVKDSGAREQPPCSGPRADDPIDATLRACCRTQSTAAALTSSASTADPPATSSVSMAPVVRWRGLSATGGILVVDTTLPPARA